MGSPLSRQAIERVYREQGTQLWRGVYAFTGGRRDLADDAVAEAFARALQDPGRIRSPVPWLYRVAFRQAAARLREERRQDALPLEPAEPAGGAPAEAVPGVLARLTPQQRAAVFLFYYADLSIADVARATGSSQVAVRVHLHRARQALRSSYGSAAAMRASPGGRDDCELA